MKIRHKRKCAVQAKKGLKEIFDEERRQDRIMRHLARLKRYTCPHVRAQDTEVRPAPPLKKEGKEDKKAHDPSSKVLNPNPSPTGQQNTLAKLVCTKCDKSIFHFRKRGGAEALPVCQCGKNLFYGCFWQEPHPKDGWQVRTVACFRANNRSCWSRAQSRRGARSAVKMSVKLPEGKLRFGPDSVAGGEAAAGKKA